MTTPKKLTRAQRRLLRGAYDVHVEAQTTGRSIWYAPCGVTGFGMIAKSLEKRGLVTVFSGWYDEASPRSVAITAAGIEYIQALTR